MAATHPQERALAEAALAARRRAHAPYSRFAVGAALLDEQGRIHAGANIENAAYPQGMCAEAVALAHLVMAGGTRVLACAVAGEASEAVTPCGGCRQKLREFAAGDVPVLAVDPGGVRARHTLGELLPSSFGPSHLAGGTGDGGNAGPGTPGGAATPADAAAPADAATRAGAATRADAATPADAATLANAATSAKAADPADPIAASVATLRARLHDAGRAVPAVALLLGSGWAPLADRVEDPVHVPYAALPAFPVLDVEGHRSALVIGRLAGREVVVLSGRKHAYETGDAGAMKGVIRTLAGMGVATLIQTNAAGSLDPAMRPGHLMLVTDHLNVTQRSPLFGDSGSQRFVDLSDAYDPALRRLALAAAARIGVTLHEGVYAWVMGPQFETPAEIRMLGRLGAQAVGMSTVPETILARHAGLRVLALSMLTNMACGVEAGVLSHAQTLSEAQLALPQALRLAEAIVASLET